MEKFLVFRLYGPMAAWGDIAVGEVRRSSSYPSRSAILGLITAAFGFHRNETENLKSLFNGYDVAIKVISIGTLLKDYHTVQVPDSTGKFRYLTRRDELIIGEDRLGTILTSREYRCDSLYVVALRMRSSAPYPLELVKDKLIKPSFVLYLGRKSCPLAAPLKPQIIYSNGFKSALDNVLFPPLVTSLNCEDVTDRYIPITSIRYCWENDAGDMIPQQTHERYDEPIEKSKWQFASRLEHVLIEGGE